jgi:hypothetical protein
MIIAALARCDGTSGWMLDKLVPAMFFSIVRFGRQGRQE